MVHQNSKVMPLLIMGILGAVFAFSLYVFLTTENTVIVINEAANESEEVFVEGDQAPIPEEDIEEPGLNSRLQVLETGVGFLNVRDGASLQARKIGRVTPGDVYEYTETQDNWYHILHAELGDGWIFGQYVKEVDRSSDLFGP